MSFPGYEKYRNSCEEWFGQLPSHWRIVPLRGLAASQRNAFTDGDWIESPYITDEGVRLIQTGNIGVGSYKEQGFRYVAESTFGALKCTEVNVGDVLICRLAEPVGRACLAPNLGCRMITSVDVCILKPECHVNSKFIVYMLSSAAYLGFMESRSRGGTRDRVSRSFLGSVRVAFPPLDEQAAIESFLDAETSKIDALVAEQRRLIELLKEKRQAVISHAVAKGLNPDAPMKPSGIEWLGDVPEHWEEVAVRRVLSRIEQGRSPQCYSRPATDDEWGVLKSGCVNHGVFCENNNKALPELFEPIADDEVRRGDVLMSRASGSPELVGSTAFVYDVRPHLLLSDKTFRLRLNEKIDPEFFVATCKSHYLRGQIERSISGAEGLANNLPQAHLRCFTVVVPPIREQRTIIHRINSECEQFDNLTIEAEIAIDLLQERHTALISAAVTGKIDVREFACQGSA